MRESFVFYKSFYDSIKELDAQDQVQIYNAIFEFEFYKTEPKLSGVCKSIFTLILPQLEANDKRYENGKKGGRPRTKTKPNQNQNKTKIKPNVNDNVNDNDNKKENIKKKKFGKYKRILLTEDEYNRLVKDFGEEKLNQQIEYLDEYVEGNNNKNKYTNFNLVLRRSIRENWFNKNTLDKGTGEERKLIQEGDNVFHF